jgi:hypothetical protein
MVMTTAEQFRAFAESAQSLVMGEDERKIAVEQEVAAAFRRFAAAAVHILLANIQSRASELRRISRIVHRWRLEHDFIAAIGATHVENSYTRIVAWALKHDTHPATAVLRQRAWLESVGINRTITSPARLSLWLWTEDGIPDIVLRFDDFVVVVEAKTGTQEHATPSGRLQTEAYGPAVVAELGVEGLPVETIYLTPDMSRGSNARARSASFFGFAVALTAALDPEAMPQDLRVMLGLILTHFVSTAGLPPVDLFPALEEIRLSEPDTDREAKLKHDVSDLSGLLTVVRLLGWSH